MIEHLVFLMALVWTTAASANCFSIDPKAESALGPVTLQPAHACQQRMSRGYPIPGATCSPGAIDPTVTLQILDTAKEPAASGFRTSCVRDKATSAHAIECFGFDPVIFGGDWPVLDSAATYAEWPTVVDRIAAGASRATCASSAGIMPSATTACEARGRSPRLPAN